MNDLANIVLLTVDCLRFDRVADSPYSKKFTKNINSLANKGVLFYEAVTNSSWTIPSLITLLTSTYPLVHNVLTDHTFKTMRFLNRCYGKYALVYPLKTRVRILSLPRILHMRKYRGVCVHSSPILSHYRYLTEITKWFDVIRDASPHISKGQTITIPEQLKSSLGAIGCHSRFICEAFALLYSQISRLLRKSIKPYADAEKITNEALFLTKKLKNKIDNNLFVWLHYMDVHPPYIPPIRYLEDLGWDLREALTEYYEIQLKISFCPDNITRKDLELLNTFYNYSVKYVDECIGYLLDKLEEMSLKLEDTLIILTADHGELIGEHSAIGHGVLLYDELVKVPLIMSGSGLPQGVKINSQIGFIDLMPTILEILGINVAQTLLGKSRAYLINEKDNLASEPVISECIGPETYRFSYRTKDWKYILTIRKKSMIEELYNIRSDQKERENLVQMEKDFSKVFREKIIGHIKTAMEYSRIYRERQKLIQRIQDLKKRTL